MGTASDQATFMGEKPPFTALPSWLRGRATCYELTILWVLQSHYPNIHPSIARIAHESGISRRKVQQAIADMERKGWITREPRVSTGGDRDSNSYRMNVWGITDGGSACDALPHVVRQGGSASHAQGVAHEVREGGAPHAHKEEQLKKKKKQPLENPLPLTAEAEPKPAKPRAKPKPAGDPYAGKILPPNAVPFDLLELQDLLPEWWTVKKGVRSEAVFNRVCKTLRGWPAATRVTAVENAIASGWANVYEPRTPSAAPSGLWSGPGGRMSEAEKALAFLAARDAAQQAHTAHYPT